MSKNDNNENILGQYLRIFRESKQLTLREVENVSGVSNAYLSQLENGKISKPSPNILHKLATFYNTSYKQLMEKAGYITADNDLKKDMKHRKGALPTFSIEELSQEEEKELLAYLAFVRSKKGQT